MKAVLLKACEKGNLDVIQKLVAQGSDIDFTNKVIICIRCFNDEFISYFISSFIIFAVWSNDSHESV